MPLSSEVDSQRTETTPRWHPTLLLSAWFTANLKEEQPPSEGAHGVQHRLAIPQSNPSPTFRNKKKTQTPEQTSINFFVTPTIACLWLLLHQKPKIPNTQNYTPATIANPIAVSIPANSPIPAIPRSLILCHRPNVGEKPSPRRACGQRIGHQSSTR